MSDLTFLSATSMAEQIRKKKLSPVELVEAHLAKITRLNPQLNAFVHVDPETALRQACVAEQSLNQKQSLGPLHGVPLSIKSSVRNKITRGPCAFARRSVGLTFT